MLSMLRIGAVLGLAAAGGCTYVVATPAVQGHAFVVKNDILSSSFWNCDATGAEPVCYQTKKQFAPQAAK